MFSHDPAIRLIPTVSVLSILLFGATSAVTGASGGLGPREGEIRSLVERLQRTKPHFWTWRVAGSYHDVGPLTGERIEAAERRLGARLPTSYLALLALQNGGELRYDHHPRPVVSRVGEKAVWVEEICGIGPALAGHARTLDSDADLAENWSLPERLFFLQFHGDYGGVALDYRKAGSQEPPVVYVDLATDDILPLAPDFATFVDGLFDGDRDHHYGFAGVGEDPQPLIKALEKALHVRFRRFDPPVPPRPDRRDLLFFWAERVGWRSWSGSDRSTARIEVMRNRRPGTDYLEHARHPEADWYLVADIHRESREELEAALAKHPYKMIPLHLPPWDKLGDPSRD